MRAACATDKCIYGPWTALLRPVVAHLATSCSPGSPGARATAAPKAFNFTLPIACVRVFRRVRCAPPAPAPAPIPKKDVFDEANKQAPSSPTRPVQCVRDAETSLLCTPQRTTSSFRLAAGDKTPGSAGKRETASWKTGAFGPAISDYSAAREEEEDAALQERWAKTPDAQPMQKPGEEHEEKFLRFLRHHKLVPHDSSVETLQGLLEDENKQRTKELLDELHEKIKSNEDDTETYDDLRSYLTETKPKASCAWRQASGALVYWSSPIPRLSHRSPGCRTNGRFREYGRGGIHREESRVALGCEEGQTRRRNQARRRHGHRFGARVGCSWVVLSRWRNGSSP